MSLRLPLLFIASGLFACSEDPLPAGDAATPDIVLISVDTLRADHLSGYGYSRETSPFFDQLAAEGTRFSFARSASPWTLPAHTTMLSGQLPVTHKVIEDGLSIDARTPILPELLSAAGYATGGFVATLYVSRLFNFDRGFDTFQDFGIHTEKANLRGEVVASDVVDEALEWWAEQPAGKPVFMFLHVYDVHYTYDPPKPYATLFDRAPSDDDPKYKNYFYFKKRPLKPDALAHQLAQYDESIRYVDAQFKRIQDAAKKAGRDVRFVITSDHGEEFGERGSWGHAHTLYAEQLHVPLIISGPGVPAGQVIDTPVGTHDIAPTIAAWAGPAATPLRADGIDLASVMAGRDPGPRQFPAETTRFKTNRLGLYSGGLRLEWDLKANRAELFDPHADPTETHDLARTQPEDMQRLMQELEALLGAPWEAKADGQIQTSGVVLHGGPFQKRKQVKTGDRFAVLPYDAEVHMQLPDRKAGPWQTVGGDTPATTDPVQLLEASLPTDVQMDAATLQALEALGYMQGDAPEAPDAQPPPPAPPQAPPPAEPAPATQVP